MSDVSLIYGNRKLNESFEKRMSIRMRRNEKINNRNDEKKTDVLNISDLKNHELERMKIRTKISKSKESEKNNVDFNKSFFLNSKCSIIFF
jgi:hypothetical protein